MGFGILAVSFIMKIVAVIFLISCVALILVILVQKGRGGGLSTALAGGVASGLLGSKIGDFLTWVTIVIVGIFLVVAVFMTKYYKPSVSEFGTVEPARQEQPTSPVTEGGQPVPPSGQGAPISGGVNTGVDTNQPGG